MVTFDRSPIIRRWLKHCGLRCASFAWLAFVLRALKPEVFSSPAKHAELVALLSAYEHFLDQHNRGDMAAVYEEAVKHPDWCPIQAQDCWTELPDTTWSPLQTLLIDSMRGERFHPRAFELSGVRVPRRLMSRKTERLMADVTTNELAFLMSPASAPARTSRKSKIALFHAGGREAEIEEVFRRILATGVPLDQVEIACASDAHVALVWEKALRHNWPVTLGPGIPAAFTRPGRALIGLCDWIETDFSAGHFRRLLQSGDLGVSEEGEGFTAGQAARLLGTCRSRLGACDIWPRARTASQELRISCRGSGCVGRRSCRCAGEGRTDSAGSQLDHGAGGIPARAGAGRQGSAADCGERRP